MCPKFLVLAAPLAVSSQVESDDQVLLSTRVVQKTVTASHKAGIAKVEIASLTTPDDAGVGWHDAAWFGQQETAIQSEADDIYADIVACNNVAGPATTAVSAARDAHEKCRIEELAMGGLNVSSECQQEKKADCDALQASFELAVCTYSADQGGFCAEREACHQAAVSAANAKESQVQMNVTFLKEEFVHFKRFECRMQKWPLTAAESQHCNALQPDVSHLDITYPNQPNPVPCTLPTPLPGDDAWLAQEYSGKNWYSLVVDVTACAGGGGGGWYCGKSSAIQTSSQASVCALLKDGTVRCVNAQNQQLDTALALAHKVDSYSVTAWGKLCGIRKDTKEVVCTGTHWFVVPSDLGPAKEIHTGSDFACAVLMDDTVRCWGRAQHGCTSPPSDLGQVTYVKTNGQGVCAIRKSDDKLICWGFVAARCNALTNVKEIALTAKGCCALLKDGTVDCKGIDTTNAGVPSDLKATQLYAAHATYYALQEDGTVRAFGQKKDSMPTDLGKVLQLGAGSSESTSAHCFLTENGLRCWSGNTQLEYKIDGNDVTDADLCP